MQIECLCSERILDEIAIGKAAQQLIVARVEVYSILALIVSSLNGILDLREIDPSIDIFNDLFNRELQLDPSLFLESLPFLPVLQPLPEDVELVRVDIAIIGAERSANTDWDDLLVGFEVLLCVCGSELQ